ncbi:hypothetical protein PLIP_a2535 [Pseudoalteromonas lipolytica LMEB 39]|nr:hypothetical protein [Pseudoalteromonas lipolytica LMEB 39]
MQTPTCYKTSTNKPLEIASYLCHQENLNSLLKKVKGHF